LSKIPLNYSGEGGGKAGGERYVMNGSGLKGIKCGVHPLPSKEGN